MRLTIPTTPPSLDEAFAFIRSLSRRSDLAPEPVLSDQQWEQAVTAAVSRGDRGGLAILLQVELVPAIARAMMAMGETVRCALAASEGDPEAYQLELAHLLEPAQLAVMRAGKATWAGEHRGGLLPGHAGPSSPPPDAKERVWAKMATYLHMELASDDIHQAIAHDLGAVLCELTAPARAAVECMDAGEVDDLLPDPLQQGWFEAYNALSAVRLHLLATYLAETMAHDVLRTELI